MPKDKDSFLWQNISSLPYFRGLLRAVEARSYKDLQLKEPVLDLGCGDGHFASVALPGLHLIGLDPGRRSLKEAAKYKIYHKLAQSAGGHLPFSDGHFSTVVSNSVLEHIDDLYPVISEVSRVLVKGGMFVFCVPNDQFLRNLSVSNFLDRIHLKGLGDIYRRFFNKISRHKHCDSFESWKNQLAKSGLKIKEHWDYFSPRSLHVLEWGHYFGLPSLIWKKLTGRWILVPQKWNLFFTERIVRKSYAEGKTQKGGVYSFYIAIK